MRGLGVALSGLLLAGGQSTRMGRDKAAVEFEGETLTDRALRTLAEVADDVVVADGSRALPVQHAQVRRVADAVADAGPLGGIVAGLEVASHPLVAVVAVDMPYASAQVFRALAAVWDGQPAVVPRVGGRLQPLHAVWARDTAPALRRRLERGEFSLREAVVALGAAIVDDSVWGAADPLGRFAHNVNTPDDLAPHSQ